MKVLVTGATGFIGQEVMLALADAGHDLVVLTRNVETAGIRLPVHCRVIGWDPSLLALPPEALEGVDAVVHLAGENIVGRWTGARKAEILRSRVLSTHHLVEAFKQAESPPGILICASGIGIYGDRQAVELEEEAAHGDGFLSEVCRKWEEEALRAQDLGVRVVPLRIGVVLGREGGAMKLMLPAFRMGLGGPVGSGEQWMSWIHVRDLARIVVHALHEDSMQGPVNCVAPEPVQNRKFGKTLGRVLGRPAFLPTPAFILRLVLGEAAEVVLSSLKVIPGQLNKSGFEFKFADLEEALKDVAWQILHEFRTEQWVPHSPDKVFRFFSDAQNLEAITPRTLSFRIVGQNTPQLEEGTRIDYRLRIRGLPVRWQSLITDWRPPNRFSDFQVMGPYWTWYHIHDFIEQDGGTLVRDRAYYRLPFWVFGEVLGHAFIRKDLEAIFQYRRRQIVKLLDQV